MLLLSDLSCGFLTLKTCSKSCHSVCECSTSLKIPFWALLPFDCVWTQIWIDQTYNILPLWERTRVQKMPSKKLTSRNRATCWKVNLSEDAPCPCRKGSDSRIYGHRISSAQFPICLDEMSVCYVWALSKCQFLMLKLWAKAVQFLTARASHSIAWVCGGKCSCTFWHRFSQFRDSSSVFGVKIERGRFHYHVRATWGAWITKAI